MIIQDNIISSEEKAVFALRSLYSRQGYRPYKMSKFEDYDLYVRNKDFLVSHEIITFTDTGGRLMALKPDVTLSIIKNSSFEKGKIQKLYYDENVYRVSAGTGCYKEILQAGVECIGDIDEKNVAEVVCLAAESLNAVADIGILDLSHMGILTALVDALFLSGQDKTAFLKCIGAKNSHELRAHCEKAGISVDQSDRLCELITTYGRPERVLPKLRRLLIGEYYQQALDELEHVILSFTDERLRDMLRIDFSVVNNMKYYNGIVFKGFVSGVPESVLSGGQYDGLVSGMKKNGKAIGFAVYMDLLGRLSLSGS